MLRNSTLVHPAMLCGLKLFYHSRCTIQVNTPTINNFNERVPSWVDKANHVNLPCRLGPKSKVMSEAKAERLIYAIDTHTVALQGHYGEITPAMRAVVDGVAYDILGVRHDDQGVMTALDVQRVT